ncbi:metallophosphoesterase [Psychroserpens sp.]|uniref:metallophosphoesterase n=1 Tax=Psychroserpens sp. TaxID=2020870 RepID=UPI001AFFF971|nr:metallophosphoesterase [Psychroserpens sp.]MBO6607810.1 metallophosphoesterase [Psychroserpens sp.]MBO6654801.1 metallophosphoesterase [Psychroserpens sp.]MBO6682775.1 metallophosphoesterase [Psychroserpens sp.]MBO6751168.1 metallophosphoesterase [Psychroserpens sp.]MBO6916263.1 metallophosphoesterase [Psychroserpens sp.]
MLRWVIFIIIYSLFTFYGFQAIKTITKATWLQFLFIGLAILIAGNFIYQFSVGTEGRVLSPAKSYAFGFLLAFMSINLVIVPILLGEDILRLIYGAYEKVVSKEAFTIPSRRKFISQIALGLAAIPFTSLLYGMYKGKYNFRVLNYTLHFEDLPEAFDGYRITQISDIHSGSFDNREKLEYGINLINEQASDAIMFTGDMVNNKASEMIPWKDLFGSLNAKDGIYSVLGNHDYGDYVRWESKDAYNQNLEDLKQIQKEMGYDLLLNESRFIEKDGQRIAVVGVENWGKGGFKKAGDLRKAAEAVDAEDFKILMSHDPSHWEECVVNDDYHYHLTLSGHTHGMQFGIEIPGWIKWSPVKWRYKHWAGVYQEFGQYLNVNRGFGYLAYPGRVGIWPEVTVITLKKGASEA